MRKCLVACSLALAVAAGCDGSSGGGVDQPPSTCLQFEGHYQDASAAAGMRSYLIDSMESTCTDRADVYYCEIGTFAGSETAGWSADIVEAVVDLSAHGPLTMPFGTQPFFEQNGTFGYSCAPIDRARVEEIKSCITTQSSCPALDDAKQRMAPPQDYVAATLGLSG